MVSILVPVYNAEKFLDGCVQSILSQTYNDLQIVLIDDGSKDNSWSLCQDYASRDARIEVYHQDNQGVAETRNQLLSKARGDYVLFVDADDWIEPDMVEFLINKAKENEAEVTVCGMVINNSTVRKEYTESILNQEECVRAFLFHSELRGSLWNKLVATSLLHNVRFHCGISYGEDALFCWHFLQNAQKIVMTDRQLYHYRMNETSISHQSFGEKKLTGHLTWSIITEETSRWWPQFLPIAQARWGLEDMYLLRQAGQSNYKENNAIREIQKTVKMFIPQMKSSGLLRGREIFNAYMMCHWYGYNILYNILYKTFRR